MLQPLGFAVSDDGSGIAAEILAHVLTVGFSTRYGSREGIGRFGVGFKLASISQAKHMDLFTRPAFLNARAGKVGELPIAGNLDASALQYFAVACSADEPHR